MTDSLLSGMTRRTMLKATAATTAGAALFSESAAATNPVQINFCGCSQVCMEGKNNNTGHWYVITAIENGDNWTYEAVHQYETESGGFCWEITDDRKIIALRSQGSKGICYYCNPGQCAEDALGDYKPEEVTNIINPPGNGKVPDGHTLDASWKNSEYSGCTNDGENGPGFGTFDDCLGVYGKVEIVQGRCGTAGKDAPPRGNDDNNGNNGNNGNK